MSGGEYLTGVVLLGLMLAGSAAAAAVIVRKRMPELRGFDRAVALALLTTIGVLFVHMLPGALGILGRATVLAATALWLAMAAILPATDAAAAERQPVEPRTDRVSGSLAGVCGLIVGLFSLAYLIDQLTVAPGSTDVLGFHLPDVARWIQSGSLWGVNEFVIDTSPGRYPQNGNVLLLAAVLPFNSDFLSHFVPYAYYWLTGLAIFAVARSLRAGWPAALAAACLILAIPAVAVPALVNSFPDVVMLFGLAAGLLFLVRHQRSAARSDLILAGLGLGVAFGTKWYAVSTVAIVVVVWAVSRMIEKRDLRLVATQAAALAGLIALAGGFWLLRNWVQSGNPIYPAKIAPFGVTVFDAPRDVFFELAGYSIADYLDRPSLIADSIVPALRDTLGLTGALIAAAWIAVSALLFAPPLRRAPERGIAIATQVCALLLGLGYLVTPYTAGGPFGIPVFAIPSARYAVPALVLAAIAAAWSTRARAWAPALFAAAAMIGIVDGVRIASQPVLSFAGLEIADWLAAGAIALAGGAALLGLARMRDAGLRRAAAALAVGALAACVAGGYLVQRTFIEDRYRGLDETADWIAENAPEGERIGLAGTWGDAFSPPLPAFGPRFGNEVEYVGPFVEGTLRAYESSAEFGAALRRGEFDFLIVGRGNAPVAAPERRWALAAGFEPVVESATLTLLRAPAWSELDAGEREHVVAEQ